MKKKLLPKDLLNDLERETNVKERIMRQLAEKVDQPRMMDTSLMEPMFFATSTTSFSIAEPNEYWWWQRR